MVGPNNGAVAADEEALVLGELVPETIKVRVLRHGQSVELEAYVFNNRCPGRVKALLAAADARHRYAMEQIAKLRTPKLRPGADPDMIEPDEDHEGRLTPVGVMVETGEEDEELFEGLSETTVYVKRQEAWFHYARRCLMALIKGLEDNEADVLSGDEEWVLEFFYKVGFWQRPSEQSEENEDEVEEEDKVDPLPTMPQSSPSSVEPTRRRRAVKAG